MLSLSRFSVLILVASLGAAEPTSEQVEFFEKKIRPMLVQKCYGCHNSKMKTPLGGLRLSHVSLPLGLRAPRLPEERGNGQPVQGGPSAGNGKTARPSPSRFAPDARTREDGKEQHRRPAWTSGQRGTGLLRGARPRVKAPAC